MSSPAPEKLAELRTASCSQRAVQAIQELILEGSDFDCHKINAFRIARQIGEPRHETLRAFLFATCLGIFDMAWEAPDNQAEEGARLAGLYNTPSTALLTSCSTCHR